MEAGTSPPTDDALREAAVSRLRKKRDFATHVLIYVLVNSFLVVIWAATSGDFFWPMFPIFGWGIGLVFHAWDVLWPQPSETAVRNAMDRISRRR